MYNRLPADIMLLVEHLCHKSSVIRETLCWRKWLKHLNIVWNNASKQHMVGYSQSQQVFIWPSHRPGVVFSTGRSLCRQLRVQSQPTPPPVAPCCHGNCRWFSTALNLLLANAAELIKCNCLRKKLPFFLDEALPESRRGPVFDSWRIIIRRFALVKILWF